MEGFSSPLTKGLLPFKVESSANLAELNRRPRFTPTTCFVTRTLGFRLKKEKKKIMEK